MKYSYMYAFVAILFWSSAATAFKITLSFIQPYELILFSSGVSSAILLAVIWLRYDVKKLFSSGKKNIYLLLGLGFINPALYYLASFKSYQLLSAQQAQPITYSWVLILVYMSAFFYKKRISKVDIIAGIICYVGVFVVASGGDIGSLLHSNLYGLFFALLAAFLWAFYWLLSSQIQMEPIYALFLNFFGGFVFLMLLSPWFFNGFSWQGVAGALYIAVFEMSIAFLCWLQALKISKNSPQVVNLAFLTPFISLIFIAFILGEKILFSTFVGLVFIVGGLILQKLSKKI